VPVSKVTSDNGRRRTQRRVSWVLDFMSVLIHL